MPAMHRRSCLLRRRFKQLFRRLVTVMRRGSEAVLWILLKRRVTAPVLRYRRELMRRFASYVLCGLASTCFAIAIQAQDASTASVPAGDKTFVTKAAQGGMAEVNLGKLAAEKASRPDVKEFGNMMVEDHSKANEQLKSVAGQKSLAIPPDVGPKHQAVYDRLSKLS